MRPPELICYWMLQDIIYHLYKLKSTLEVELQSLFETFQESYEMLQSIMTLVHVLH